MIREIKTTDIVGKTIEKIENTAVNVLKLYFTDGTSLELEAEQAINTQFGPIPGIFVSEGSNEG